MDKSTIETYSLESETIANLHQSLVPKRLYQLVLEYFQPCAKTLDIGCGMGRDTAWLYANGFQAIGIDASPGMLNQARKRYPQLTFREIALPELSGIDDGSYYNALCSAVLMHLEHGSLNSAAKNILRILSKGGILLLSFRGTQEPNERENGKLYETITKEEAIELFEREGGELLFYESMLETARNHLWHTFVFRKTA